MYNVAYLIAMVRRMGCFQNFGGELFFWIERRWDDNIKIVRRLRRLRGMEMAQEIVPNIGLLFW